ncbi:allantoinase [Paenibacillus pectinilyticus]|uniref:Allantoinase n=1 Tax=Paenibacillus pectinilyticus TaxID=512399 RepID=A0A1C0ZUL3_9BACL|nr:allantoinase [Paenibacillus pectinilyticus]OCT11789.1 allantoinase [Paenibacillus pectinilyticus]
MSERLDLIIRNGSVVGLDEVRFLDIGIKYGRITHVQEGLLLEAEQEIDASGNIIMAGMIDVHVHLNEPGLGDWEGFASGSAALAAGGCTTYFDMPLNGVPPTVTVAALKMKLAAASGYSHVDYALWGGLVPGHLDDLEALNEAGVIGFKAFMSAPGDPGEEAFREVDDLTLWEGMKRIARMNRVLALHAESEAIVSRLTREKQAAGEVAAADYSASRPIIAELEAVNRALFYAEQTGCALHFVHISSEAAVQQIVEAKRRGMDVTLETCPHYLALTDEDLERMGPTAKCAPPLRSEAEREKLWEALRLGWIDMISSDHSPCPGELKESLDYFEAWGGISGAQSSLEVLLDEGYVKRGIPLPHLSRLLSYAPAQRFGLLPRKGEIRIGADADLVMVSLTKGYELKAADLWYKHKHSPYVGRKLGCKVLATWSQGRLVYEEIAGVLAETAGEWVKG